MGVGRPNISIWIFCLLAPLTAGQWFDPWISESSSRPESVTLISNQTHATISLNEDVPPGQTSTLGRLNYVTSASQPQITCTVSIAQLRPNISSNYSDIILSSPLDYETINKYSCFLILTGVVKTLNFDILDVNDNGPIFMADTPTNLVFKENEEGFVDATFMARDADAGDNARLLYTIKLTTGGDHFQMETLNSSIIDTSKVGKLKIIKELDYEEQTFYILTITVQDPAVPPHTLSIQAVLSVIDQNDLPPEWIRIVPVFRMSEDTEAGSTLFNVTARDGDRGIDNKTTYTIEDDSNNFEINANTGVVTLKRMIDRDVLEVPSFDIKIVATEVNELAKSAVTTSTIIIDDVNDNDPYFDPDGPFNMSVPENTTVGFYIGNVRALDIDLANVIKYEIPSCDNSGLEFIEIRSSNGQITVKQTIDREQYEVFHCIVKVTDSGDPPRSNETNLTINVLDINDNSPVFAENMQTNFTISEDSINGTRVGQVYATDADSGEFGKVNYLFYRINDEGGDQFEVDLETGEIRVRLINGAVLDFDTKPVFSFYVEARDYYRPNIISGSNFEIVRVTVTLTDVNDNAPTLPPSDDNTCFASISENAKEDSEFDNRVNGFDIDEPNTDNSRIEYAITTLSGVFPTPNPTTPIFRIETSDNVGILRANVNMDGFFGDYRMEVNARDFGTPRLNSSATYRICVKAFNQYQPVFQFPGQVTEVSVQEDNPVNQPLLWYSNSQYVPLVFAATDADKGENGKVSYGWAPDNSPVASEFFSIDKTDGSIFLTKQFIRDSINNYTIKVRALDGGDPDDAANGGQKSQDATLLIKVRVVLQYKPEFASQNIQLSFTENEKATLNIIEATDKDNDNLLVDEEKEPIYYHLIDGNAEYFDVLNTSKAELSTAKELDRENPPAVLFVIIEASNDKVRPNNWDCSHPQIDCSSPSYLNVSIKILDVNDNAPQFDGTFFGGISSSDQRGKVILTFYSTDADENDSATYTLSTTYTTSDPSIDGLATPFTIKAETSEMLLNFDVQDKMKGFFRFNVTAADKAGNEQSTAVSVYVVLRENRVTFTFNNERTLVETHRTDISNIFTDVYVYRCIIEGVTENPVNEEGLTTTSVLSYFVDEKIGEPVLSTVIDQLKNDAEKTKELRLRFSALRLDLTEVKSVAEEVDSAQQLFLILFIVACIIILPLIAFVIVLSIRGAEANRKVKALTSTKFGSQSSEMNRIGATVPNTNLHAVEGSNPIWSMEERQPQEDNISESSGDSILIGVEDNPEFRNYQGAKKNGQLPNSKNPPMPFQDVSRRNPLLELNDSPQETRTVKRSAPPPPVDKRDSVTDSEDFGYEQEDDDSGSFDIQINSNFTFGNENLTSM